MIDIIKIGPFTSTSLVSAYSKIVGAGKDISASPNGEIVGVKVLEIGSPTVATAYIKLIYSGITGTTGTIFDLHGSGTVSGATPAFYPARTYAVDNTAQTIGSPNSSGIPYPVHGDLQLNCGSLGSPITFSGVEVWIKR